MAARRIAKMVRVHNPSPPKKRRRAIAKRRARRRNPGEQLSIPAIAAFEKNRTAWEKLAAKHLRPANSGGRQDPTGRLGGAYVEMKATPRGPTVLVPVKAARQARGRKDARKPRAGDPSAFAMALGKRRKKKAAKKHHTKRKAARRIMTRIAARRGGTVAKKRAKRGRRRIRCVSVKGYTNKKGKHISGYCARRRNPSVPEILMGAAGIGMGAGAGIAISYGADRLGLGTPMQRNWGMVIAGLLGGALVATKAPLAGVTAGAGLASVGLLRSLQTVLYAPSTPASGVAGLGMGDGTDFAGAYDQLGGKSVFDQVGEVMPDMGAVYDE